MGKHKLYWNVTSDIKIEYGELFEDVKNNLTTMEAKLIWYLRNMPYPASHSFCLTAEKLYRAFLDKLALTKIFD